MKKKLFLSIAFLTCLLVRAQTEDAWVYFKDKPNANSFLSMPLTMLSQRALDRRARFQIPLDFKDVPIESAYINQIKNNLDIIVKSKSKWLNAVYVSGTQNAIRALTNFNFVSQIDFADRSLNIGAKSVTFQKANQQKDKLAFQSDFNYGISLNQLQMLQGDFLHQKNFTGKGINIAILDAGFPNVNSNQAFKRIMDNNQILWGYNFVDRNNNIYSGHYHGTAVLSTMAGFIEGQLVGSAPDANYYLFITEDATKETPLEESLWVEAAEKADSLGVDIINSSLGYTTFDNSRYNYTYADMDGKTTFISRGAEIAFSRGIIVVNSVGNEGSDSWHYLSAPADAKNVLSVGAVDAFGNIAKFSSFGPSFDGRVKPDVSAQGVGATIITASGNIGSGNGTSFSSPILAGVIASFWQAFPTLTNVEVVKYVKESAHLFLNPTPQEGYGIPNFQKIYNQLFNKLNHPYQFIIYPNPTENSVSLVLPVGVKDAEIFLINDLGKIIIHKTISDVNPTIDISHIVIGYYFLQLKYKENDREQIVVQKLIKK